MTTFDDHLNNVRHLLEPPTWADVAEDEEEADYSWDAYWTWRTEHPDEYEQARQRDDEYGHD